MGFSYILMNQQGLKKEEIESIGRAGIPVLILIFKGELRGKLGKFILRDAGELFISVIENNFKPFENALKELKIQHVVIDSLMKCGIMDDDYNGQKQFVDCLCWAAKTYGGHIHLIHHIRKTRSEEEIPDKFDVMGASALTNLVDNVFSTQPHGGW